MPKRVLISGASGFVGANLARRLLREGHDVNLVLRRRATPWRLSDIVADVRVHAIDLADAAALTRVALDVRPDWVFHLAAYGAYAHQTDAHEMVASNLTGVINLLDACLRTGFELFVNSGSSSEYGFKRHAPSEDEVLEPNSAYAVSKASATLYCRFIAQSHRLPVTTLRLYSVYGPYEEPARLMPSLLVQGLRGRLPPLVHPEVARDFIYVDDVVDAYLQAAASPDAAAGGIFNVGTGIQTSLRQLVDVVRSLLPIASEPRWGSMAARVWDTDVWVADPSKLQRQLGWRPRVGIVDGLGHFLAWLKDNPSILGRYEADRRGQDEAA